ncbi:hypothetical protein M405DRAFT_513759 [Rhizopogon salebrosus TDB-379]|nr:hypothetical protein M405DRAFT_513759 [Rhizopogon salebrosus TDB-379]
MLVFPRLPTTHSFRYNSSQNKVLFPIAFLVLWVSCEHLVDRKSKPPLDTHIHLAFTEAIKLFLALGLYSARTKYFRFASFDAYRRDNNEDQPLDDITLSLEDSRESITPGNIRFSGRAQLYPRLICLNLGGVRSNLSILVISALYSLQVYVISKSREYIDSLAQYLVIPAASLCSLFVLRTFFCRTYATQLWHAALLQVCRSVESKETA